MDNSYKNDVTIVIPTLNECYTIEKILIELLTDGFKNIIVIDGNSTDNTAKIASKHVKVINQTGKGKGNAIKEVIPYLNTKYVLFLDGDGTNPTQYVDMMIQPLLTKNYSHTIGNRLLIFDKDSFTFLNLFGNILFNKIFKIVYKVNLQDILSGYRGFTLKALKNLNLESDGFEIEIEISAKIIKKHYRFKIIPTYYKARDKKSSSKLKCFQDGKKILKAMWKYRK